ncbi:enterotoxin [Acidicapsa dinghuensis]|uniref:Enterotoxin n=1 Tax=Acidicapsa dinghuensis TaxID=2218256 RepID=A0ABW1EG07_9BACT|nr:enterotoxin [Acidicapsa dinghuensis]
MLALAYCSLGWGLGATPNDVAVHVDGPRGGVIADHAISAEWKIEQGHITTLVIHGLKEEASLKTREPFSLAIHGIGVLRTEDFSIAGKPSVEALEEQPNASRLSDRLPGSVVRFALTDGSVHVEWSLIMRSASEYVRQELTVDAGDAPLMLGGVRMVDFDAPEAMLTGTVLGTPIIAGNYYLGFESPLSESSVVHGHAVCELHRGVPVPAGQTVTYSAVMGVAPSGQMRRAFSAYVERERAHPYRTFLHYNSWFDIGFFTPYTQADALNRIHAIGEELHVKRGVTLDSYLFDDGWDDHNDLWKIRSDFKDGLTPLKEAAAQYGTAPGIWLSPWGGYGPAKKERVATAKRDGYEIVNGGMALSGPKYYQRFHDAVMEMVTRYGVNQFKFDGTGNADQVVKGSQFSSDFDAAIHLIEDVRKVKPDMYINLTTGTYPSPFWLRYADSIWRGGDDTEFAGVGTDRERWITYRDADTYSGIVKQGHLFPLNSLMLHGIVFAQKAPHLETDPGHDFRNEVRSYFGTGTQLQEMYITPSLLSSEDWDVLAEAAKWSRRNAETLKDTHWIGGDPRWLEVYGWAAWSPEKGIVTLRNPSDKPQTFVLDVAKAFELPAGAPGHFVAKSPWRDDAAKPAIDMWAGHPTAIELAPFQVMTLETVPQMN